MFLARAYEPKQIAHTKGALLVLYPYRRYLHVRAGVDTADLPS